MPFASCSRSHVLNSSTPASSLVLRDCRFSLVSARYPHGYTLKCWRFAYRLNLTFVGLQQSELLAHCPQNWPTHPEAFLSYPPAMVRASAARLQTTTK